MARKHRKGKYEFPTIEEFIEGLDAINGLPPSPDTSEFIEDEQVIEFIDESLTMFFNEHFKKGFPITLEEHERLRSLIIQIALAANKKRISKPFLHYLDGILCGISYNRNNIAKSMRAAFALGWAFGEKGGET